MTEEDYTELERQVNAHPYHQQETYQIEGNRYVLEKRREAGPSSQWSLWIYPQGQFARNVYGPSVQNVFGQAAEKGYPVETFMLAAWHD